MNLSRAMEETSDADLVAASLAGDRDAFGRIVDRYKTLVSSLAYSGTGSIAMSEDLAQETFITAWSRLGALQDRTKLRSWLCGIARHRLQKHWDRVGRRPDTPREETDTLETLSGTEPMPSELAITREEEGLLWRALERIPATYREPLILFYREQHSVAEIATALEISEDAAKQRLSRGRKLLEAELQNFVASALRRSRPGAASSGAVLAALPGTGVTAGAIGAGASAKGAATAKSAALFTALAPFAGLIAVTLSQSLLAFHGPGSRRERLQQAALVVALWAAVAAVIASAPPALRAVAAHWQWTPAIQFTVFAAFWTTLVLAVLTLSWAAMRRQVHGRNEAMSGVDDRPLGTITLAAVTLGLHAGMYLWVVVVASGSGDPITAWVIGALALAQTAAAFALLRRATLRATTLGLARSASLACAVLLAVLNLRLDTWLAYRTETTLAAVHATYPIVLVPLCSLFLIGAWVLLWRRSAQTNRATLARG